MNVNIIKKANDIVNAASEGYVAVVGDDGYPNCATRSVRNADGIYSCYFTTGAGGRMADAIEHNGKASVCFRDGSSNVTLIGDFEVVADKKIKSEIWVDWFIDHYSGGPSDPMYFVTKFVTHSVSLWIDGEGAIFDIAQISKPQSRCGLLCDFCSFKASHGCMGCIEMHGHPFWGECDVAACAQNKGYVHCGECSNMPCEDLTMLSCGEGEHSDRPKGARLEILRYWEKIG